MQVIPCFGQVKKGGTGPVKIDVIIPTFRPGRKLLELQEEG